MQLSQQSQEILLQAKQQNAICVAKTNGKITITRRFEGDSGRKYVTNQKEYIIPFFFNPFHKREKIITYYKMGIRCYDKIFGKIVIND